MRSSARRKTRVGSPAPGSGYWILVRHLTSRIEVFTNEYMGFREIFLPVFSSEEEARKFLPVHLEGDGWQPRPTGIGELISVLWGPCAGVERVAVDPAPEMVDEGSIDLVSVDRTVFADSLLGRGRHWYENSRRRSRTSTERVLALR